MSGKQFEVYHLRVAGFLVAEVELEKSPTEHLWETLSCSSLQPKLTFEISCRQQLHDINVFIILWAVIYEFIIAKEGGLIFDLYIPSRFFLNHYRSKTFSILVLETGL